MSCPVKQEMYKQETLTNGYIHESEKEIKLNIAVALINFVVRYFVDPFNNFLFVENDELESIKIKEKCISTTDEFIPWYYNVPFGPSFEIGAFRKLQWISQIEYSNGNTPTFGVGVVLDKYNVSGNEILSHIRRNCIYFEFNGVYRKIRKSYDRRVKTIGTLCIKNNDKFGIMIERNGAKFDITLKINDVTINTITNVTARYIQFVACMGSNRTSMKCLPIQYISTSKSTNISS